MDMEPRDCLCPTCGHPYGTHGWSVRDGTRCPAPPGAIPVPAAELAALREIAEAARAYVRYQEGESGLCTCGECRLCRLWRALDADTRGKQGRKP